MPRVHFPFCACFYLFNRTVQERSAKRIASRPWNRARTRSAKFDPSDGLVHAPDPWIRGCLPAEVAGEGTREFPSTGEIPTERGRGCNQIARLAGASRNVPPGIRALRGFPGAVQTKFGVG